MKLAEHVQASDSSTAPLWQPSTETPGIRVMKQRGHGGGGGKLAKRVMAMWGGRWRESIGETLAWETRSERDNRVSLAAYPEKVASAYFLHVDNTIVYELLDQIGHCLANDS